MKKKNKEATLGKIHCYNCHGGMAEESIVTDDTFPFTRGKEFCSNECAQACIRVVKRVIEQYLDAKLAMPNK